MAADGERAEGVVDFQTEPSRYRHWKLAVDGEVATLSLDVDENGGLFPGYALKLNSYDLGVDIELADAVQRLRFEHPAVKVVVMRSAKDRVFCAGANIRMLAGASHGHKVNFCKFTNETRNAIEDASAFADQKFICVITGTAAGGGYELALAADHIMLVDDGSSSVALPEVPLLAVLPGTGGLTRVDDFRARSSRPEGLKGIALTPLRREIGPDRLRYSAVEVEIDRATRVTTVTVHGPDAPPPAGVDGLVAEGAESWMLRAARELDDAILHLRLNERETAVIQLKTLGDPGLAAAHDRFIDQSQEHWLAREIRHLWKRVLKRLDLTSRTLVAVIEPGSCFSGTLAELAFAADRSYMLVGRFEGDNRPAATLTLSAANFGPCPMVNGLTRLETRFLGTPEAVEAAKAAVGRALEAEEAEALGLVTFALDDIDWEDEIRVFLEERASFSPDALTGMEANLRFGGPETMESKIFARLTAWQNWIFQRPNAVGPEGALRRYGTGQKAAFDMGRV